MDTLVKFFLFLPLFFFGTTNNRRRREHQKGDQPADSTTFFRDDHAKGRHRGHHESCRRDNHEKVFMRVTLSFSKSRGRDHVEWKERLAFCRRGIECEAEESESVVIVVDDDA